ncbi:MAG: hypothetical protein QOF57_1435 [Frankiaceae bacterium]|jgi:hypothetical protein|nr:hypothetical protein [Frankiaceae bacterium]
MADTDIEGVPDVTEPEDLEHHIERTRDDLAITIDAIADRMSPKRAASRGVASAREAARNAVVAVEKKVAELRAPKHASGPGEGSGAMRLPNPGMTSFRVERRPQNAPAIAGAVAALGLLVGFVLRRRSKRR